MSTYYSTNKKWDRLLYPYKYLLLHRTLRGTFTSGTLRVERRKWGNAASIKFAARSRRWSRDNVQSRSSSAKCCELYASLHDRFRLEVRMLFYPMRTWKFAAWVPLIIADMRVVGGMGDGVQVEGGAGVRGAAPVGCGAPRLSRNEVKMFHEQILSRNEAWLVKIRKQMIIEKKNNKKILSASAFISSTIEFSIPDFKAGACFRRPKFTGFCGAFFEGK